MEAHTEHLVALDQRIESILGDGQDPATKSEQFNQSIPTYECGKCAWTTTSLTEFVSHYMQNHVPPEKGNITNDACFRIPRQSMVGKATQAACQSSEPDLKGDQEEEEGYMKSLQEGDEEAYSIITRHGRLYIDYQQLLRSPQSNELGALDARRSPRPRITVQSSERTVVGCFRRPPSTDRTMTYVEDDDDGYPEAFALDEDELP